MRQAAQSARDTGNPNLGLSSVWFLQDEGPGSYPRPFSADVLWCSARLALGAGALDKVDGWHGLPLVLAGAGANLGPGEVHETLADEVLTDGLVVDRGIGDKGLPLDDHQLLGGPGSVV